MKTLSALAIVAGLAASASAQYLMVTNFSSGSPGPRSVMLFNKSDGSLVNKNWIVGDATNVFSSQTEAIAVGTDVWISDQVQNKIFRYDLTTGSFKSAITGSGVTNLSNIRGMERVGNTMYVANAGSGFGNSIVRFDVNTGAYLGSSAISQFVAGTDHSPWDIQNYNGQLLVSVYAASTTTGTSRIDKYDYNGNYLGNFYLQANSVTTGIRGPQQIIPEAGGKLLIGGFSGTTQASVYEIDGTTAATLNIYADGLGPRAAFRLDNGNIMFTKGDGVWTVNPVTNLSTPLLAGTNINAKYISEIGFVPTPSSIALMGIGALAVGRRRR